MVQTSATLPLPGAGKGDVLRAILELVRERGFQNGDKLPSLRELAEALGLKAGLIRDALLQAQTKGLVRILPRAGTFLQSVTPESAANPLPVRLHTALQQTEPNLFHLLDARRFLEIELAGRAAERRRLEDLIPARRAMAAMMDLLDRGDGAIYAEHDVAFHVEIARLAGNTVLFAIFQALMESLRPHFQDVPLFGEERHVANRSHAAIYAAVAAGDAGKVRAEMTEHLSKSCDRLLRELQEAPMVYGMHEK